VLTVFCWEALKINPPRLKAANEQQRVSDFELGWQRWQFLEHTCYPLWATLATAWELTNNVTYSDIVLTNEMNHCYFVVDAIEDGSWFARTP
jgi:hypothetical protein